MDLEQALKKAPLFLAIIFSHFCVFLAEQWNHDVIASSKTGILPNCLSPNDEEVANSSKKDTQFKTRECTNHTLFQARMVEINTLSQTKTAKNHTFIAAHNYIVYIRDCPPGTKNALQVMSLTAYASGETKKTLGPVNNERKRNVCS